MRWWGDVCESGRCGGWEELPLNKGEILQAGQGRGRRGDPEPEGGPQISVVTESCFPVSPGCLNPRAVDTQSESLSLSRVTHVDRLSGR